MARAIAALVKGSNDQGRDWPRQEGGTDWVLSICIMSITIYYVVETEVFACAALLSMVTVPGAPVKNPQRQQPEDSVSRDKGPAARTWFALHVGLIRCETPRVGEKEGMGRRSRGYGASRAGRNAGPVSVKWRRPAARGDGIAREQG